MIKSLNNEQVRKRGLPPLLNSLESDGMLFSVGVRAVCRDDVADPAERAASPDPEPRREDQPQYPRQNAAVIELPHSRNNQT